MFDSHAAERKYYQLQDSSGVSRCSVNVIKYDLIKTQCFGRLLIADHNDYDLDKNICGTLQKSEKSETYIPIIIPIAITRKEPFHRLSSNPKRETSASTTKYLGTFKSKLLLCGGALSN